MRTTKLLLLVLVMAFTSCKSQVEVNEFADLITADNLKELLTIYASDDFEGRETGQPGQKKASEFLKNFYIANAIPSALPNNYYQEVPLQIVQTPEVEFNVNDTNYEYYEDYFSYSNASSTIIDESNFVYLGFGIDDEKHNDYKTHDVKGKIVVVKGGEPKDNAGNYVVNGSKEISKWSNGRQAIKSKKEAAIKNGAKALILIDNKTLNTYSKYFKKRDAKGGSKNLSLTETSDEIHFFVVGNKIGQDLLTDINITKEGTIINKEISINYKSITIPISSENVAALIKGSEKPNEYIVISAHLDHLGVDENGHVFNGADDDGSGTVALLNIAKAFKKAADQGNGPKRSILFLHVTGEEKGLLGSKYYTNHDPIVPLNETITNLNIDMIGRVDPKRKSNNRNYLYLIGSDKLSSELHNLSEEVNKKYMDIEFDYTYNDENDPNRYYYRSDHYNFAKNNIPVIFYFNGTHDDYHAIGDTPDKIEYDLLENRTRLVFLTAWEIANREKTIEVDVK